MATGPNHRDLESYLRAWADMMINIWQEKVIMLGAVDTWELYHSFTSQVLMGASGSEAKISFGFREYGFYVNAGVGREIAIGNTGDTGFEVQRIAKPWFDQGWYKSIYALKRDVARIYGEIAAKNIVFYLNNNKM